MRVAERLKKREKESEEEWGSEDELVDVPVLQGEKFTATASSAPISGNSRKQNHSETSEAEEIDWKSEVAKMKKMRFGTLPLEMRQKN
jgi:hypothetical protein